MFQDLSKFFRDITSSNLIVIFAPVASFVIAIAVVGSGNKYIAILLPSTVFFPILTLTMIEHDAKKAFWELGLCYFVFVIFTVIMTTWSPVNGALALPKSNQQILSQLAQKNLVLIDIIELAACALLAFLTAGFGGLVVLTRELNGMAYLSAAFYMNADKAVFAMLLPWTPWGILKVLSMLMTTIALYSLTISKIFNIQKLYFNQSILLLAIGLAMLSIFLRIVFSHFWVEMIFRCGIVM